MPSLYFDSSLYSFIQTSGEEEQIRRLIRDRRHRLLASAEGNLTEAFRIPDSAERTARIRTITRVAHGVTAPRIAVRITLEFLDEVRRLRPAWLRRAPRLADIDQYRSDDIDLWVRLRKRPDFVPPDVAVAEERLAIGIGEIREAQKKMRQLKQTGPVSVASTDPVVDAALRQLPPEERYMRSLTSVEWRRALQDPFGSSATTLLIHRSINVAAISDTDWDLFWLQEVDDARMPFIRFGALVELEQQKYRITLGNPLDRIHAAHLLTCDSFFTCDDTLARVTKAVASRFGAMGNCHNLPRADTSVVAALEALL